MSRRWALVGVGCLTLAVLLATCGCAPLRVIAKRSMTPGVPFEAADAPEPPDYADPAAWTALPGRDDAGDAAPPGWSPVDEEQARADVFYIHPTSFVGRAWNGPVDDPKLNDATDSVATHIQATAFGSCCRVYGPRYRQATGAAFLGVTPDGEAAIDFAYADVVAAFDAFHARRGADRPFIVAGHSQGAILGHRLLTDHVVGTELEPWLVAAYLPGAPIPREAVVEAELQVCTSPRQTGCLVSWNARSDGYRPRGFDPQRPDQRMPVCTNPMSWLDDGRPMSADQHRGAVFLEASDPAPRPNYASAVCDEEGILRVELFERPPRDFQSWILDRLMGAGNYHPIEMQLFYSHVWDNARERVDAFCSATECR